ncbi:MAG TPA: hypothetical protein VK578_05455 [Edaphobacter sp.]|jgi:hypothetical protein|nr:hypothetical protein [Edaphobacter sp.]
MNVVPITTASIESVQRRCEWFRYSLIIKLVVAACFLLSPLWLWALFFSNSQAPYAPSLVFVPLAVIGCMVGFMPLWRGDPYLKQLLRAGILARLAAASLYIWIGFFVYDTSVDAFHYWSVGMHLADDFSVVGWSVFQPPYTSTNLINNICGFIMLATGNTLPTLFVLFALAALWGGYFFYRAFSISFPTGDQWLFGLLTVLLPSNLFWSSAIGKDSLAQLFIGISAYGFARVNEKLGARSIAICSVGIAGMLVIRPHIAAMLALSITLPFAIGKTKGGWMNLAARIILIPALVWLSLIIISQAGQFVGVETADSQSSIETVNRLTQRTQVGGSAFNSGQSLGARIAESPFLMFRPLPWEVNNAMGAVASLEAMGLLFFAWSRRRNFLNALRNWREPFIAFILMYSFVFSVAFAAATSNFGILARERIMMVPLLLMLFCAKPQTPSGMRPVLERDLRGMLSVAKPTRAQS